MTQLQAQLEGLAIGLEQRGEKSAAHVCRMALAEMLAAEAKIRDLEEAKETTPMGSTRWR